MEYVTLHARVNTLMAHKDIQNFEKRNILFISMHFISMHFIMTKRLQNIALVLDEEERKEDTILTTQKRYVGFSRKTRS